MMGRFGRIGPAARELRGRKGRRRAGEDRAPLDKHDYDDCVDQGIDLYWTTLGKCRGLAVVEEDDLKYVISADRRGPERIFHMDIGSAGTERLHDVLARMQAGTLPNGLLVANHTDPQNRLRTLEEVGFRIDTSGLCMVMDLASRDLSQLIPDGFQIIRVTTRKELEQWTAVVNVALFGRDLMSADQFCDIYGLESTALYMVLCDGVPASTCMTIHGNGVATLEMVSTLPDYRRRGLATAVVRTALLDLQRKVIPTVSLRAEPDGIGVYKSVGFVEHCKRVVASCR
jgi:ribosomal protein S18 acetylase RimI-like enzyme